jgi:Copper amine oxidase N-terminal domain
MKKFLTIVVIIMLLMPSVLLAAIELDFVPVGHGPLKGELGLPLKTCSLPDGEFAVLDGATRKISIFGSDGEFQKYLTLPKTIQYEILGEINDLDIISSSFLLNNLDIVSNSLGEIFLLTSSSVVKLEHDGRIKERIGDFTKPNSMIKNPISFDIGDDGNFYVLDKRNCVVVLDLAGKQLKSIGEIGKGKKMVSDPVMVWVEKDNVIVLDNLARNSFEPIEDDNAIVIWDRDGSYIRELASFSTSVLTPKHKVYSSWAGDVVGDDIYLLDLDIQLGGVSWVVRHFQTNGDFVETTKSPVKNKNPITSAVFDIVKSDKELFLCLPFLSKILSIDGETSIGNPEEETLTSPASSCPLPDGGVLVLEGAPASVHHYDKDGNHVKTVAINSKTHGLPGLDWTIGVDISCNGKDIFVATGNSILILSLDTLETTSSLDLPLNIDNPGIITAICTTSNRVHVLDTKGELTTFNEGLPITTPVFESMKNCKLVDVATDMNGNILILSSDKSCIGWFTPSGDFTKIVNLPGIKSPSSICITEKGLIFVSSKIDGKIYSISKTGSIIWEGGQPGILENSDTVEDYASNPGYLSYPMKIRATGNLISVLDFGNFRCQLLTKVEAKEPKKTPAKLKVEQTELNFGETIYYPELVKKVIQIKNIGELPIEGTVTSSSEFLKVAPSVITNDTLVIYATYEFDINQAWSDIPEQTITIESNGGTVTVKVLPVTVVGKIVYMDIGNPIFRVKTVGEARDFETDRAPVINNDRTYVPLRALGDVLGAGIDWNGNERKVTFELDGNTVELWIGKNIARVNGKEVELTDLPIIINDSTYVPVRFVSERLGAGVGWISETRTVEITYPAKK